MKYTSYCYLVSVIAIFTSTLVGCDSRDSAPSPTSPLNTTAPKTLFKAPSDETITSIVTFAADGTPSATWSASGLFSDFGTETFNSGAWQIFHSPVVATEQAVSTRFGTQGSFTMRAQRVVGIADKPFEGAWVILSGTGQYSNLHGQGTWNGVITSEDPFIVEVTFQGQVHFQ